MCANYHPVTARDRLLEFFGVERPDGVAPPELAFPLSLAPFIVRAQDRVQMEREFKLGRFGLLPYWAGELAFGRRTYNARAETASSKPSFKDAWLRGRRCIVPAEAIFEPNYESGKAVRWRISRRDGRPMGIAGLWGWWRDPKSGQEELSFTMLTVNADEHALMKRFHRAGEEKRMVVILEEAEYSAWLDCPAERMHEFMRCFPAERLEAEPDPLPR
jgi:putative SOS response-associated peptidase YedK